MVPAIVHEGISKLVLLQAQALYGLGYVVKLIALTKVDKGVLVNFAPVIPSENIIELHQPDTYLSERALKVALSASLKIKRLLANEKSAVVFAHAPYAHFLLRLAMLLGLKKHKSLTLWQYFHMTQYAEFPLVTLKRKFIHNLNKWLAERYDYGHIFVSNAVEEDIQSHLVTLRNSHIIYNAIPHINSNNQLSVKNKAGENRFTILLPGRVEVQKGQIWFLEPFSEFIKFEKLSPNQVQLVIAGIGSKLPELECKIQQMGLESYVQLVGKLPNREVVQQMKNSTIVVIPSLLEGFGLVCLEALASCATVLSSDAGGLREIIDHTKTGFLFKAKDVDDCLEKLSYLYRNRNKELISRAEVDQMLGTKFSFEKHIQQLTALIERK